MLNSAPLNSAPLNAVVASGGIDELIANNFHLSELLTEDRDVMEAMSLAVAEAFEYDIAAIATNTFGLSEAGADSLTAVYTATEVLGLSEAVAAVFDLLVSDSVALADGLELSLTLVAAEQLLAQDVVSTQLEAITAVSVALALAETAVNGFEVTAVEIASLAETFLNTLNVYVAESASASLSETGVGSLVLYVEAADGAALSATTDIQAVLGEVAENELKLKVLTVLGEDVYAGWVMNTHTTGTSRYSDFPFNSVAEFDEQFLGASEEGIFTLSGETDDGANFYPSILTGATDFGNRRIKRLHHAEVGVTAAGQMMLKAIVSDGVRKREVWHQMRQFNTVQGNMDTSIARGLRGVYWQFELVSMDDTFDTTGMTLFPLDMRKGV